MVDMRTKINLRALARTLFRHRIKVLVVLFIFLFFLITFVTYLKVSSSTGKEEYERRLKELAIDRARKRLEEHLSVSSGQSDNQQLSSLTAYCNPPGSIEVKAELLPSLVLTKHHLSLESVIILIRHGDRGPLRPVTGFKDIPLDPISRPQDFLIHPNLINIFDTFHNITRKQPRSNLLGKSLLPFNPSPSRSNRLGQLTVLGSLQHLKQGQELAHVYLPVIKEAVSIESFSQRLEAYTTVYERTFQSATSLLYGLLTMIKSMTPDDVLRALLNKIKSSHGTYFCMDKDYCIGCGKVQTLQKQLDQLKQEALVTHSAVNELMSDVIKIIVPLDSELSLTDGASKDAISKAATLFPTPESVIDGLMAYLCHATPLPCREGRCVSIDDTRRLMTFVEAHNRRISQNDLFLLNNMLKVYGFLQFLVKRFNQIANVEETYPRFSIFSAHDITLTPVASVLGFWDYQLPPYASRMVFEVYRQQGNENAYVRILYNGKDVTKNTDICKKSPQGGKSGSSTCTSFSGVEETSSSFTLIPSNEFESFLYKRFIQLAKTDNYEEACYSEHFNDP